MQQLAHGLSSRKRYDQPVLRHLTVEQATLLAASYAYIGHCGAREILEEFFPCPSESGGGRKGLGCRTLETPWRDEGK